MDLGFKECLDFKQRKKKALYLRKDRSGQCHEALIRQNDKLVRFIIDGNKSGSIEDKSD